MAECCTLALRGEIVTFREAVDLRCDIALASIGWSYLAFAYVVVEYNLPNVPFCPFAMLTGDRCPLCGSTHFIGLLLHGDIGGAQPRIAGFLWFALMVAQSASSLARLLLRLNFWPIRRGIGPESG